VIGAILAPIPGMSTVKNPRQIELSGHTYSSKAVKMRLARNTPPYTTDYETPLCAAVRTSGANTSGAKLIHVGTAAHPPSSGAKLRGALAQKVSDTHPSLPTAFLTPPTASAQLDQTLPLRTRHFT